MKILVIQTLFDGLIFQHHNFSLLFFECNITVDVTYTVEKILVKVKFIIVVNYRYRMYYLSEFTILYRYF